LALQGTLDTFALADVLRLLATTAKTGRLRVEGDRGQGSVWLRDGTVMAAAADRTGDDAAAEEVIFELLRFGSGSFRFEIDELSPNGEQPEDVEILLRNAGALLSEWNELEAIVPSVDHRVQLVPTLSGGDVTIDARRWPSVVAAASGGSVKDLAGMLGLSELGVSRTVRDLVDLGIAEVKEPSQKPRRATREAPTRDRERPRRSSARIDESRELTRRPAPLPDEPPRDLAHRTPFGSLGSGETLGTPDAATTGELQRAGWLQSPERTSGSQPALPSDGHAGSPGGNGHGGPSLGNGATPSSASPSARRPRSGASSKRPGVNGRANGRSGVASRRDDSRPSGPPSNGDLAPRMGRTRPAGAPRRGGSGRSRHDSGGITGPLPGYETGSGLGGPRPGLDTGGLGVASPAFDTGSMGLTAPGFDTGPLGPSPLPPSTGPVPPVPSAIPPDLQWAVDDDATAVAPQPSPFSSRNLGHLGGGTGVGGSVTGGAIGGRPLGGGAPVGGRPSGPLGGPSGPAPGNGAGGPSNGAGGPGNGAASRRPPVDPSKVAPHVAAMSPEARAAVQGTVGNGGGSAGAVGPGEDLAQRGQLISFLSSVRP
jgi:hypothetical protein